MTRKKGVARVRRKSRAGAASTRSAKTRKGGRKNLSLMASAEEAKPRYALIDKLLDLYRPVKKSLTMRVDADVLQWFKRDGRRYQTRINRALRKVMVQEMKEQEKKEGKGVS